METIKSKRAAVLQDTVQYYSQDPEKRRSVDGDSCCYSPKTVGKEGTSEGCAVGRLLSPELQEELDANYRGMGVLYEPLFHTLPQKVQDLGQEFLISLQDLHDFSGHWDSEGLTEEGKKQVQQIRELYGI